MRSSVKSISIVSRDSPLARAQVQEVLLELQEQNIFLAAEIHFLLTEGDKDKITSLLNKEKSDFFTKELDDFLLAGFCDVAIHSAKDLPDPMREGLIVVAYTKGVDPSDVLVLREEGLPLLPKVGTSSLRRIQTVSEQLPGATFVDIRGTIDERLALLDRKEVDAVVMAKAALIRLRKERKTIPLIGEVAPMQGRLAVVARKEDEEMQKLFSCLNVP